VLPPAAVEELLHDVEGRLQAEAGHRAQRAALIAVDAVLRPLLLGGRQLRPLLLDVDGAEVLHVDDVVGACNDARGAADADLGGDYLFVQVLPVLTFRSGVPMLLLGAAVATDFSHSAEYKLRA
jgi:hypothetical protein